MNLRIERERERIRGGSQESGCSRLPGGHPRPLTIICVEISVPTNFWPKKIKTTICSSFRTTVYDYYLVGTDNKKQYQQRDGEEGEKETEETGLHQTLSHALGLL